MSFPLNDLQRNEMYFMGKVIFYPETNIKDFIPLRQGIRVLQRSIFKSTRLTRLPLATYQNLRAHRCIENLDALVGDKRGEMSSSRSSLTVPSPRLSPLRKYLPPLNVNPHQKNSVIWSCHLFTGKIPLSRIRHDMLDNRKQKKSQRILQKIAGKGWLKKKVNMKRLKSGINPAARLLRLFEQ